MATFTTFDGLPIAYSDTGDGAPVVLLHGFLASSEMMWVAADYLRPLAADGRRPITMDLRGHGESAKPHNFVAYEDLAMARDVVALADHLGLETYDLVGYSLGSIVAMCVVSLDPRVRSVVLGGIGDDVLDPDWDRPPAILAALLGEPGAAEQEPFFLQTVELMERKGLADRRALAGVQHGHVSVTHEELGAYRMPTLVVCGHDDDFNGDPRAVAAAIPSAELIRVDGDHMTAFTSRDAAGDPQLLLAIRRFLDRTTPVAP